MVGESVTTSTWEGLTLRQSELTVANCSILSHSFSVMTPSSTTRLVPFRNSSSMVMVTPTWGTEPPGERTNKKGWERKLLQNGWGWGRGWTDFTWKKSTVIHFFLLLSLFHFLIHFLFFSSENETQTILALTSHEFLLKLLAPKEISFCLSHLQVSLSDSGTTSSGVQRSWMESNH